MPAHLTSPDGRSVLLDNLDRGSRRNFTIAATAEDFKGNAGTQSAVVKLGFTSMDVGARPSPVPFIPVKTASSMWCSGADIWGMPIRALT